VGLPEPPPEGASALPEGTFDGSVVLVTGGGTGLGKAIALEFARLGARLVLASRKVENLQKGLSALEGIGAEAEAVVCDVRDPDQVDALFDGAGSVDVLVNNAAGNFPVAAEELSPNGFRAVVDIVLNGTFYCSRAFARRAIAAGSGGSIINIGASYAWTGGPGFAHSAAAKAAVKNLTETLAVEWAPYGIRVNCLVPGLFPHEDEAEAIRNAPGRHIDDEARAPAQRAGRPRELGWAATFLASPYAAYVTGHTLVVDGANWQRRSITQPPFVPVREQLGDRAPRN
jgi:NAD(P)-dependent dehydrogenase (short-subunit alcohol dehydrogenase family)